jgi:hypothetical protein
MVEFWCKGQDQLKRKEVSIIEGAFIDGFKK